MPRIYKISQSKKLLNIDLGTNNEGNEMICKREVRKKVDWKLLLYLTSR